LAGNPSTYGREFAVDSEQLFAFLIATQPEEWAKLGIGNYKDKQGMARQKFLARLQGEITRRGVIDVLRHGIKHGALSLDMFTALFKDDAQLFKQFQDNESFRGWLTDTVFEMTYDG
jgi:type I restriction enzyme R subunit